MTSLTSKAELDEAKVLTGIYIEQLKRYNLMCEDRDQLIHELKDSIFQKDDIITKLQQNKEQILFLEQIVKDHNERMRMNIQNQVGNLREKDQKNDSAPVTNSVKEGQNSGQYTIKDTVKFIQT